MIINRWVSFIIAIGIISSVALVYFYNLQRDFTKNHREFLVSINNLENLNADLAYQVLQSSLYVYSNQDSISKTIQELEQEYKLLKSASILKDANYKLIKLNINILERQLKNNIQRIEDYQMLNAAVKNSLLFLSRHIENASAASEKHQLSQEFIKVFVESIKILKRFNDSKQMQDMDYLDNSRYLLESSAKDIHIHRYINNFNMHAEFLIKKYPLFLDSTKVVLDNNIHNNVEKIRKDFSKIAVNDFNALDIFTSILFSVFILSLTTIIILFIKYLKENKQLTKTKESLEHSLIYDHLTDLYNRRALELELESAKYPHLLLINIDRFKHINDIYGNEIGNQVIKKLAKLISIKVDGEYQAKVYRVGGDEFGVLFSKIWEEKALQIADMLEKEISNHHFRIGDLTLQVLVSIASNNIQPIIENADMALKLVKKDKRKKILAYKDNLNIKKSVQENMETIELIKNAIEGDRIVPFFQPIVNLKTSKIEKYESLVRLKLDDGGFLPPFKFLETSKKTRYYRDITRIMIDKTLRALKDYPMYRFSVNISMIDILDDDIVDILITCLEKNESVASRFDIELLETENLQDIQKVQEFTTKVKSYGCKILIDDFGSGYSNFSYFADIDVDIVKIDGSIVKEITTSDRKLHMLRSIYQFSKGMRISNVAEFVETREMALLLREVGVEYGQGYYFSQPLEKPLDSDEITI